MDAMIDLPNWVVPLEHKRLELAEVYVLRCDMDFDVVSIEA